jgi:pimeloyl-ACP methyl ester carboxylesterase
MRLITPDGASLALFELGTGHAAPAVLFAHATGFHGRCWQPVADALDHASAALDFRGFGDSTPPSHWDVDWRGYGLDALVAARERVAVGGAPVIGVGHSMGGAALLMAALDEPALFAGLVLFEPIVMPPLGSDRPAVPSNALADGARRRRSSLASFDAAIANFGSKPPMNTFTAAALEAYVRFGLAAGDDGQVHLKCTPEHEARTYETGGAHGTFERLGDLRVPARYVSGRVEAGQPSAVTELLAERTPGAAYHRIDHVGHFGPMEDPGALADEITRFAAGLGA